jgi:poly(3-hydroxyalkanoate) synthetase
MTGPVPEWLNAISLPDWVRWVAQDADGSWWAYEVEPLQYHAGWYENELGRRLALRKDQPMPGWEKRLFRMRP